LIAVPEKKKVSGAIPIADILPDWHLSELKTLLERPIFDEAVYGTVRFHHRSVREFLTSKWILQLLDNDSRREVENLFFRVQYEEEVLTPKLRPIIPWVAIFNDQFQEKALRIAPEVLLEGGDPSKFPASVRSQILKNLCQKMADHQNHHHSFDITALERFSNSDIEQTVSHLFDKYNEKPEIITLLLRMVWRGQLTACVEQAISYAQNMAYGNYTRICALRAIEAAGTTLEKQGVVKYFINDTREIDFSVINTFIELFGYKEISISDLLVILSRLPNPEIYKIEGLDHTLEHLTETISLSDVEVLIKNLARLLAKKPHIDRTYYNISQQHAWLVNIAMIGCERLVRSQSIAILRPDSLKLLSQGYNYQSNHRQNTTGHSLTEIVPQWPKLNEQLFWYEVAYTRAAKNTKVTSVHQVSIFGHFWDPEKFCFEVALNWITTKAMAEDKQIALSIAYDSYVREGRKQKNQDALKKAVSGIPKLEIPLNNHLIPPPLSEEVKKWIKEEEEAKDQQKQIQEEEDQELENKKAWLFKNTKNILDTMEVKKGLFTESQKYLFDRLITLDKSQNRQTHSNWHDLIKDQSYEVAEAFRDFLIACWRLYQPAIYSEKNSHPRRIPKAIAFGLSGISIEFTETSNWPSNLTPDEVEHALKYSLWEDYGFPNWFPQLYKSFPQVVEKHLLKEIKWELMKCDEQPCYDTLSKVASHGGKIRGELGKSVLKILQNHEPKQIETLWKSLEIIFNSEQIVIDALAVLAPHRIGQSLGYEKHTIWFAVWVSITPQEAVPKLELYLTNITDTQKATGFAMRFLVNLMGEKYTRIPNISESFKQAKYLEKLYFLMNQYIRTSEDINRKGQSFYSPGLRDDAQEARDSIFSILKQIPGKATFLALKKIASKHSNEKTRSWMQAHARSRAEQDADIRDWTVGDIIDFANSQERKPSNARQLFELSASRLLDLKNELENSNNSVASTWQRETEENKLRILITNWLNSHNSRKYSVHPEQEQADAKKTDILIYGYGFDTPVPIELKIADKNWSGPKLFERLENQLCNDYLRDPLTTYGIFLLVYRGNERKWEHPTTKCLMNFDELLVALQQHAQVYIRDRGEIDDVSVIGIDLTKRLKPVRL